MKKNYKPVVFTLLLVGLCFVIGGTIAYYTSSDTFNNEFDTGTYKIETQEAFVSPDNWTPGTTTPKTVIATNKGTTPAAVRIKLTPSWEDANGDPLPLKDGNDNDAAIINFASNLNSRWIYDNGYYYYKKALNENDSTTTLIDSVTFNPDFDINNTKDCETVNGVTTCTTEFIDYAGGKYTLQIEVETAQYDKYQEIWSTDVVIKTQRPIDGMLMQAPSTGTLGSNMSREYMESVTIVDHKNYPSNAYRHWDCSAEQNETVIAWIIDEDHNNRYELYIGQDGGVIANPNSAELFKNYYGIKTMDLEKLDTSYVTDMSYMFEHVGQNSDSLTITGLDSWDTGNVIDMNHMFYSANDNDLQDSPNTTFLIQGMDYWDTGSVADMSYMFGNSGNKALTYEIGDLSRWDVSNVTSMDNMFNNSARSASEYSLGDLSNWNTKEVTTMNYMFYYTASSSANTNIGSLSNWKTGKVTSMEHMFESAFTNSQSLLFDLSNWDVSNVTSMYNMFNSFARHASSWSLGDLSNWDTRKVTNMVNMFSGFNYYGSGISNLGTLNIYASNINNILNYFKNVNITLNIHNNPESYTGALYYCATANNTSVIVNYESSVTNIDAIVATKSSGSHVVKGSQLD